MFPAPYQKKKICLSFNLNTTFFWEQLRHNMRDICFSYPFKSSVSLLELYISQGKRDIIIHNMKIQTYLAAACAHTGFTRAWVMASYHQSLNGRYTNV